MRNFPRSLALIRIDFLNVNVLSVLACELFILPSDINYKEQTARLCRYHKVTNKIMTVREMSF